MKQTIRLSSILFCLGVMLGLAGCYDDKGNYDYTDITTPLIDTTGFAVTYAVEQFQNLVIDPPIQYGDDTENLSYEWLLYTNNTSSQAPPSSAVASTRILDRPMNETPGGYYVELVVTDTKTGIKNNMRFTVTIQAAVDIGWLVLHSRDGHSDVDFIVTKNAFPAAAAEKWLRNMYSGANGEALAGEGRFITQTRNSIYYLNYINIGTSASFVRASGTDLFKINDQTDIFLRGPMAVSSQAHAAYGYFEGYISNGSLYMIHYGIGAIKSPATIGYYAPVTYANALAPFVVDLTTAAGTTGASSGNGGVFYDTQSRKFVRVPFAFSQPVITAFTTQTGAAFDVNNVGKDLLYMERAYQDRTYAFFKDVTGDGRWLYIADFYNTDAGTVGKAVYDMTGLPEIINAKFYQCGDLSNLLYYATDRTIYSFDYSGSGLTRIAYDGFAGGEVITSMKIYKPKLFNNLQDVNNRLLYVATWNEASGTAKLYEFAIDANGGTITQTPLNVFEGFDGKIMDMCRKVRG
jgi:hypothetical protein